MSATLIAETLPIFTLPPEDDFVEATQNPERVRQAMRLAKMFEELPHIPTKLRDGWKQLRHAAVAGKLDDLHAGRDEYVGVFEDYIATTRKAIDLAAEMQLLPALGRLEQTLSELTCLRDEIFSKWHTVDDLAELVLDLVQLSPAELKAIAAANPPPQSWYEETIDPFAEK